MSAVDVWRRHAVPAMLSRGRLYLCDQVVVKLDRAIASLGVTRRVDAEKVANESGRRQQSRPSLPLQTASFVGRVDELKQVESLLALSHVRLLTLFGSGGTGKTRLALEAATRLKVYFPDGTFFVPLISVSTAAGIEERIVQVLALREDLREALAQQKLLVVLDNFEHLIEHAGWVAETLDACPAVNFIVTSREALNLRNEWVLPLGGLPFPAEAVGAADASGFDAVRLFDLRARQVQQDFDVDGEIDHVAHICRLVEGLPLALELASSWLRTLSPREIAAEIQHNLNILYTKYRDVESRHRSLEAVFEQSWTLLAEGDQKAFERLAIFRGGFSRDAAESVADVDLAGLDALIDKSLVRHRGEDRYDIHELLRQFGEARLEQNAKEHRSVLTQCSTYYANFLDLQTKNFGELLGAVRLSQLGQEIGNIQRALNYLLTHQRVAEVGRSLVALCYLYQQAGWLAEGEQDFAHVVDRLRMCALSPGRDLALARALTGLAWWWHCHGRHEPAVQVLEESLSLLREPRIGATDRGLALLYRGRARRALGDHKGSRQDFRQANSEFADEAWPYGLWLTAIYTAELDADQGLLDQAAAACADALAMTEYTEVVSAQIFALAHTGAAETRLGELRRARRHLLQAARLCRDHPVIFPVAALLASAAVLLEQCGDHGSATSFARLACARPDADFQVRHVAQTVLERAADVPDNPPAETDRRLRARYALELEDHDDLAVLFERLDNLDVDSIARPALTHREREVLGLLVRGASNLQIARRLGVAEGTVKRYTHHLFAKLGVQNRAEAVYRSTQWNLL